MLTKLICFLLLFNLETFAMDSDMKSFIAIQVKNEVAKQLQKTAPLALGFAAKCALTFGFNSAQAMFTVLGAAGAAQAITAGLAWMTFLKTRKIEKTQMWHGKDLTTIKGNVKEMLEELPLVKETNKLVQSELPGMKTQITLLQAGVQQNNEELQKTNRVLTNLQKNVSTIEEQNKKTLVQLGMLNSDLKGLKEVVMTEFATSKEQQVQILGTIEGIGSSVKDIERMSKQTQISAKTVEDQISTLKLQVEESRKWQIDFGKKYDTGHQSTVENLQIISQKQDENARSSDQRFTILDKKVEEIQLDTNRFDRELSSMARDTKKMKGYAKESRDWVEGMALLLASYIGKSARGMNYAYANIPGTSYLNSRVYSVDSSPHQSLAQLGSSSSQEDID